MEEPNTGLNVYYSIAKLIFSFTLEKIITIQATLWNKRIFPTQSNGFFGLEDTAPTHFVFENWYPNKHKSSVALKQMA